MTEIKLDTAQATGTPVEGTQAAGTPVDLSPQVEGVQATTKAALDAAAMGLAKASQVTGIETPELVAGDHLENTYTPSAEDAEPIPATELKEGDLIDFRDHEARVQSVPTDSVTGSAVLVRSGTPVTLHSWESYKVLAVQTQKPVQDVYRGQTSTASTINRQE